MGAVHSNDPRPNFEQKPEGLGSQPSQAELLKQASQSSREEAARKLYANPGEPRLSPPGTKGINGSTGLEADVSDLSSTASDATVAAQVTGANQQQGIYNAGADVPALPPAEESQASIAEMQEDVTRMTNLHKFVTVLSKKAGLTPPASKSKKDLAAWFAGTSITALSMAIQQMASTSSKQTLINAQVYKDFRRFMENVVHRQAELAIEEGVRKAETHQLQKEQKQMMMIVGLSTLGVQAAGTAGMAWKKVGKGVMENFGTISKLTGTVSQSMRDQSESSMHAGQIDVERKLGLNQAEQIERRDIYDNFKGVHDKAGNIISTGHDEVTRMLDALQQTLQRQFQVGNIGRS